MVFLFQSLYDMPRLPHLINVVFWEQCGFPRKFSNKDMSWNACNVIEEVLWSIRGPNFNTKSPYVILQLTIQWNLQSIRQILQLTTLLPNLKILPNAISRPGISGMPTGDGYSSGHPAMPICSTHWDQCFQYLLRSFKVVEPCSRWNVIHHENINFRFGHGVFN